MLRLYPFLEFQNFQFYVGEVNYNVDGFCERNRDVFYDELILLMQSSGSSFIRKLFPDTLAKTQTGPRARPKTAGFKIKTQV